MRKKPVLVVPTPTFSNVENSDASSTDIDPVSPRLYATASLVGITSVSTPEISTELSEKYIP